MCSALLKGVKVGLATLAEVRGAWEASSGVLCWHNNSEALVAFVDGPYPIGTSSLKDPV